MSDLMKLDVVDTDGAIREAEEAVGGDTRADLFRKAAIGGGAALGGGLLLGGLPELAVAGKPSARQDIAILNFALTLEFLEADFYKKAERDAGLTGEVKSATRIVTRHENRHVAFLKGVLGSKAVKRPNFDFGKATKNQKDFLELAVTLEDTGVRAYSGQGRRIKSAAVLKAAVSILTVEARHASRFRTLNGDLFAPRTFDASGTMKGVLRSAKPFIVG